MSRWQHNICLLCWDHLNPGREPIRIKDPNDRTCCYCGNVTLDGILVRENPDSKELVCGGGHEES